MSFLFLISYLSRLITVEVLAQPLTLHAEEFQAYILTLGLEPLLVVASALLPDNEPAKVEDIASDPTALSVANERGWTSWTAPPAGGSRSTFLKEPLARLYEERIAAAFSANEDEERRVKSEEMKEVRRSRGQSQAEELKLRKRSIGTEEAAQLRLHSKFTDERPMSDWDLVISRLTGSAAGKAPVTTQPSKFAMEAPEQLEKDLDVSERASSSAVSLRSVHHEDHDTVSAPSSSSSASGSDPYNKPLPPSPQSLNYSPHISPPSSSTSVMDDCSIHPALRPSFNHSRNTSADSRETWYTVPRSRASMQHPIQTQLTNHPEADLANNTAERAIFRIVEMGFTAEQARHALMTTDMGDGLRVDRAVELLLRTA